MFQPKVVDKALAEKLKPEYPAILRWLIEGCLDWQKNGLQRPKVVTEATDSYFAQQDSVQQFIDDRCDRGRET